MPVNIRPVAPELAVSPQMAPSDLADIAAQGYRSIMCNRPDGEDPHQPAFAEIRAAAEAAGLTVALVPIVSGALTEADIDAFAAAVDEQPGPMLAYCRTGTRCVRVWALTQTKDRPVPEILSMASAAGYDLSDMAHALVDRAARSQNA